MKGLLGLLLSCLILIVPAAHRWGLHQGAARAATDTGVRVPVVLELFTSEGCSSCPPADALLARLEEQQPIPGAEIIALEEHVDYWDHQGWIDPFSSAQWTQRQESYAAGFGDHGVYTPELVVNGRSGFVGSHEGYAYRTIASAVAQPRTPISLTLLKSEKHDQAHLKVEVEKLQGAQLGDVAEVWLAITENALHSAVLGGENSGHDLHHAAVVRWLHKAGAADTNAAAAFTGESDLKLDSAWKRTNLRVVAFVQEKRSRHILGAASARVEP
jgi:hypothetical protein